MRILRQIRKRLKGVFFPKRTRQPNLAAFTYSPTNFTHSHSYTQYTQPTPAVLALTGAVGDLQYRQIRLRRCLKEFIASIDPPPPPSAQDDDDSDEWYRDVGPDEEDQENKHKDTLLCLRRKAFQLTERLGELQAWLAFLRTTGDRFVITKRQARALQDMLAAIWEGARQLEQLESDAWDRIHRAGAA